MANETVEALMRKSCDALLAGDVFGALENLTTEAANEVMAASGTLMTLPMPTAYQIDAHDVLEGEHAFKVRFETPQGPINASATWREVDGAWKIAALHIEGYV